MTRAGCTEPRCGLPALQGRPRRGWVHVKVAGTRVDRWYCCGACAVRGIVRLDLAGVTL